MNRDSWRGDRAQISVCVEEANPWFLEPRGRELNNEIAERCGYTIGLFGRWIVVKQTTQSSALLTKPRGSLMFMHGRFSAPRANALNLWRFALIGVMCVPELATGGSDIDTPFTEMCLFTRYSVQGGRGRELNLRFIDPSPLLGYHPISTHPAYWHCDIGFGYWHLDTGTTIPKRGYRHGEIGTALLALGYWHWETGTGILALANRHWQIGTGILALAKRHWYTCTAKPALGYLHWDELWCGRVYSQNQKEHPELLPGPCRYPPPLGADLVNHLYSKLSRSRTLGYWSNVRPLE